MEAPIRLLVVDEDPLMREGLARLLARDPDVRVVGQARTGAEALDKVHHADPTLVLSEMRLSDMDGAALARQLMHDAPRARVALMSRRFRRPDLVEAAAAGVCGYITKSVQLSTLADAVKRISRGEFYVPPESCGALLQEFLTAEGGAQTMQPDTSAMDRAKITEREREVLHLLVQGATNRDIAGQLDITENTVKVHLRNILDKLHLRNRQQAAAFAVSSGLVKLHAEGPHNGAHRRGEHRRSNSVWRRHALS